MREFSFKDYVPSVSDKSTAKSILDEIFALQPSVEPLTIDLTGIIAMTTICARIIFGTLYVQLGPDTFKNNILITGESETLRIVINWGIESAVESQI